MKFIDRAKLAIQNSILDILENEYVMGSVWAILFVFFLFIPFVLLLTKQDRHEYNDCVQVKEVIE